VAILGTGKKQYEKLVADLAKAFPGKAAGVVKFSAPLAHQITAGADFMLVPSRFEPCGLIQLHAMQYGTVPLVSSTGGLVDTVKEGVTGFHMGAMDTDTLVQVRAAGGLGRAVSWPATPCLERRAARGHEGVWEGGWGVGGCQAHACPCARPAQPLDPAAAPTPLRRRPMRTPSPPPSCAPARCTPRRPSPRWSRPASTRWAGVRGQVWALGG
jgi:hypothetical protein